jgi:hypothetical protein
LKKNLQVGLLVAQRGTSPWHGKHKNHAQNKEEKQKSNILTVTLSQLFSSSYIVSDSLSHIKSLILHLNIFDDFMHSSMTYLLNIAGAFLHILLIHKKQQDAKLAVKMVSKNKYCHFSSHIKHWQSGSGSPDLFPEPLWAKQSPKRKLLQQSGSLITISPNG